MKFKELTKFPSGVKCPLCNSSEVNLCRLGNIYSYRSITVHYFCLLLASDVKQAGLDKQGILGFLLRDIKCEVKRATNITCSYCGNTGATIMCAESSCGKQFHLNCGIRHNSIHYFVNDFKSYCGRHRKDPTIPTADMQKIIDPMCAICFSKTRLQNRSDFIWPICCKPSTLLHRDCIQELALSSGYYFKCPLCGASNNFSKQMINLGIFIPEREASWENPDSFNDLLISLACEAEPCLCPDGSGFKRKRSRWELISCNDCGGTARHLICAGFKRNFSKNNRWICSLCMNLESKKQTDSQTDQNTGIETESSTSNNISTIGADNIPRDDYYKYKNMCYTSTPIVQLEKLPDYINSTWTINYDESQNIIFTKDIVSQIPVDNSEINCEIDSDFDLDDQSFISFEDYRFCEQPALQLVYSNGFHDIIKDENLECSNKRKRKFNNELSSDGTPNIDSENYQENESRLKKRKSSCVATFSTTLISSENISSNHSPKQAQSILADTVLPVSAQKKILQEGVSMNIIHSPTMSFHQNIATPNKIIPVQIQLEDSEALPVVQSPLKDSTHARSAQKNFLQGVTQNIIHSPTKRFHQNLATPSTFTPVQIKLEDSEILPVVQSKDSPNLGSAQKMILQGVSQNLIHSPTKRFHPNFATPSTFTPVQIKLEDSEILPVVQSKDSPNPGSAQKMILQGVTQNIIHSPTKRFHQNLATPSTFTPVQIKLEDSEILPSPLKDSPNPGFDKKKILQGVSQNMIHSPTKTFHQSFATPSTFEQFQIKLENSETLPVDQTPVKSLRFQPDSTSNLRDQVPRPNHTDSIKIHIHTISPQGGLGTYLGTSNIKNGDFSNSYFFCNDISNKSCQIIDKQLNTSVYNEKNIKKISNLKHTNLIFIAPVINLICKFKIQPKSIEKEYEKNKITVYVRKVYRNRKLRKIHRNGTNLKTQYVIVNELSYFEKIQFGSFISSLIKCENSVIITDNLGSIYADLIKTYLPYPFKCSIRLNKNLCLNRHLNIFKKSKFSALFIISGTYKPDHEHSFFKEIISFINNSNDKRIILSTIPLSKKNTSFQYRLALNFNKKIIKLCSRYGIDYWDLQYVQVKYD